LIDTGDYWLARFLRPRGLAAIYLVAAKRAASGVHRLLATLLRGNDCVRSLLAHDLFPDEASTDV